MQFHQIHEALADVLAGASVIVAGWTWLVQVHEFFQIVASGVAIVAGYYAIKFHRTKAKALEQAMKDKKLTAEDLK